MTSETQWRASEQLRFDWDWPLPEFCELLQERVSLGEFAYRSEGDTEWGETYTQDGSVYIKISRPDGLGVPPFEPLTILIAILPNAPTEFDTKWLNERILPQFDDAFAVICRLRDD